MKIPDSLAELIRCPCCKGPLAAADGTLACAPCAATYPYLPGLRCWDLRPVARLRSPARERECDTPSTGSSVPNRDQRWWRAIRSVNADVPRQGVVLHVDVPAQAEPWPSHDSFRRCVHFMTSPDAVRRWRLTCATGPDALVDPCFLPVASQRVDLVDASSLDSPPDFLERRLAEVHRVLAPSGHGYLTGRARWTSFELAELAARSCFADGFAWVPPGRGALPGAASLAAVHRHLQAWVGFEYTFGRGVQAPQPALLERWLVRLRREHELVCWRTRPAAADWKSTPSDEPMIFGRFHFPASASSA